MTLRRAIGPIFKPPPTPRADRQPLRARSPKRAPPLDRALAGTALAVAQVTVSTASRAVGPSIDKLPPVRSPSLLSWVREQPCELPPYGEMNAWHHTATHPGGDPHHTPTTGANGRQIDDLVVSACRVGHDLAHRGLFTEEQIGAAAYRTMVRFRRMAPRALQQRVADEIAASLRGDH